MQTLPNYEIKRMIGSGAFGRLNYQTIVSTRICFRSL